jgi:glucosylceramidase
VKDVAFRNTNGTVVLYTLNAGMSSRDVRIAFREKSITTTIPAGSIATFVWKP